MKDYVLKTEWLWEIGDASAEPCKLCEEPIYSQTHKLFIYLNDKRKVDVGICVCGSCYEILKENNAFQ